MSRKDHHQLTLLFGVTMSNRHILAKISVKRYIDPDDILIFAYKAFTFPVRPWKVFNGTTELTDAGSTTTPTATQWGYSGTAVYMNSAVSEGVISVIWGFYVTDGHARYTYSTPTDSNTAKVKFYPRLLNTPALSYTTSDQFFGIVSSSSINLELGGDDGWLDNFTVKDELFDQVVDVWVVDGDTVSPLFSGKTRDYTIEHPQKLTLDVVTLFDTLSRPCFAGDNADECYYTERHPDVDQLSPADTEKPVPLILIPRTLRDNTIGPSNILVPYIQPITSIDMVCIDYSATSDVDLNRKWSVGRRLASKSLVTPSVGTGYTVKYNNPANNLYLEYPSYTDLLTSSLEIGDTVRVVYSAVTYYATVYDIFESSPGVWRVDLRCRNFPDPATGTLTATVTTSGIVGLAVTVQKGDQFYVLTQIKDYTVTQSSLETNSHIYITLNDNIEATFSPTVDPISPDSHKLWASVTFDLSGTGFNHADIVEILLNQSGIDTDTSGSFAASKAVSARNSALTIPRPGNTTIPTVGEVISELTWPLLGIIYPTGLNEVGYRINTSVSSGTKIRDADIFDYLKITKDSSRVYKDLLLVNPQSYFWRSWYISSLNFSQTMRLGTNKQLQHGLDHVDEAQRDDLIERLSRPVPFVEFKSYKRLAIGEDVDFTELTLLPMLNWRGMIVDASYNLGVSSYKAVLITEV